MTGTVHLVGAGPGDPGLLTLRAKDLLERADCVIHDYLANPEILGLVPPTAELISVGKRGNTAYKTKQEDINELLVEKAGEHRCVVRLKGGDPLCFGRGGEEARVLHHAGVPFTIVPGVTSGLAVPTYAGIPVTHRDFASSVAFVTGREKPGKEREDRDWDALARMGTLVFYMGVSKLDEISRQLIAHGRDPEDPAAIIEWGTYQRQRCLVATLATLPDRAYHQDFGNPAIIVIGKVVSCRAEMAWWDVRPLSGKRVVVTRGEGQGSNLVRLLSDAGATVLDWPTFRVEVGQAQKLDIALAGLGNFDWVAFTSAKGVIAVTNRLREEGRDARAFGTCRVAAVGPATAAALADFGIKADLVPPRFDAESLAADLVKRGAKAVLLPQADNASPTMHRCLARAGVRVETVVAYRTVALEQTREVTGERIDAVALASAATVDRFCDQIAPAGVRHLIGIGCHFVAIGEQTAARMQERGLPLACMASEATLPALVEAVIAACSGEAGRLARPDPETDEGS